MAESSAAPDTTAAAPATTTTATTADPATAEPADARATNIVATAEPASTASAIVDVKTAPETATASATTSASTEAITYTDFKLPEGVKLDEKAVDDFKAIAAEARLPQEKAQALLDQHVAALQAAVQEPYKLWNKTQLEWQKQVMADPEMGGQNFEKVTRPALDAAIKTFVTDPAEQKTLKDAFSYTGAGNHPAIVKFLYQIGKSVSEGSPVLGGKPAATGQIPAAEKLYPSQAQTAA